MDSPIHDVTRGLRMLLESRIRQIARTAVVTLRPPGDLSPGPGLNLYLYRVASSAAVRNQTSRDEAPLALRLSYLLTPLSATTDGAGDDAHHYLHAAMTTLHENPILTQTRIPGFEADTAFPPSLREQYEPVSIALQPLSLDELSKITAPHAFRLSVAYEVSLVEIARSRG